MSRNGEGLLGRPGMRNVYERHIATRLSPANLGRVALASKTLYNARAPQTAADMRKLEVAHTAAKAVVKADTAVEGMARKLAAAIYKAVADVRNYYRDGRNLPTRGSRAVDLGLPSYRAVVETPAVHEEIDGRNGMDTTEIWIYFMDSTGRKVSTGGYGRHWQNVRLVRGAWVMSCYLDGPKECSPRPFKAGVPRATATLLASVHARALDIYHKNPVRQ